MLTINICFQSTHANVLKNNNNNNNNNNTRIKICLPESSMECSKFVAPYLRYLKTVLRPF